MQAIKEKITDLKEMRKAKAEAKEEEKAEKELAKSRLEVAHEVRMAREAEAAMDFHVQKAAEKASEHEKKFPNSGSQHESFDDDFQVHDRDASGYSGSIYSGGPNADSGHNTAFLDAPSAPTNAAAPPTHKNQL